MMKPQPDDEKQLDAMIGRYSADVADDARWALRLLAERLPTASRLVYDNYNALAVGFSPSDRASEAILSIALYPHYVRLFFLRGAELSDPKQILEGKGARVRSLKLRPVTRITSDEVLSLIDEAVAKALVPLPAQGEGRVIVKSVSARQRPRLSSR